MAKLRIHSGAELDYTNDGWAEFRKWLDGTYASLQFAYEEDPYAYVIDAIDGQIHRTLSINKADASDFETNFKPLSNSAVVPSTADGQPIVTQSGYAFIPEHTGFKGFLYTVTAGTHSFFDEVLTTQVYLQGGSWWVKDAALGDYIEFAVVDKDDVLGAFALYGLTVGVDVLELGKFVKSLYLPPGDSSGEKRVQAPASLVAGLYLRFIYHSVGGTDVTIAPDYLWHEV